MTSVGIDFGTTNSVVSTFDNTGSTHVLDIDNPPDLEWRAAGFSRVFPSVYALGTNREALFGWEAKLRGRHKFEAVKRLFATDDIVEVGGETALVDEVAALLFGRLRQGARDQGVDFSRAVVTIPANSRGRARYRTKLCAGLAGIEVAALINEPTAAAMAFGLRGIDDQRILVVDWGGGTLDVTLLEVTGGIFVEHSSSGIQVLGGRDFDRELRSRLSADAPDRDSWDEGQKRRFDLDVEFAKIRLSSLDDWSVPFPEGHRRDLSRRKFEEWMRPLVERVREPINQCLRDAGMTSTSIDHLLLVGGTCMMPLVRGFVSELVGREPARGAEPLTAIAEGAAVAAAILEGRYDADYFVSTEHALGTVAVDANGRPAFATLIPRNHKLPARKTEEFVPVRDFQESILIEVIEGDPDKPLDHEDNVRLREWVVPLIPRPQVETKIALTYQYDTDGIIHVEAMDTVSGQSLVASEISFIDGRDQRELVQIASGVTSVLAAAASSAEAPQVAIPSDVQIMLDRARIKVIPFVPDEDAVTLEALAVALEGAAASNAEYRSEFDALDQALRKYAYLY